jgi:hypothetical protein
MMHFAVSPERAGTGPKLAPPRPTRRPAPHGSALHSKLLAGAAGAMMHGAFAPAREMLAAAGEWETAVALAVCQGDLSSLRELAFPGASAPPAPAAAAPVAAQPTGGGLGLLDDDFGLGELSAGFTGALAGPTGAASGGGGAGAGVRVWARALAGLPESEKGELARLARALVAAHERNSGRMFGAVNAGADWKVGRAPVPAGSAPVLEEATGGLRAPQEFWVQSPAQQLLAAPAVLSPWRTPAKCRGAKGAGSAVLGSPAPPPSCAAPPSRSPAAAPGDGRRQLLQQRLGLELRRRG